MIHKPSELTPLTALELQAIAYEAGLPEGLLTVLVGAGETAGARSSSTRAWARSLHGLDRGRA